MFLGGKTGIAFDESQENANPTLKTLANNANRPAIAKLTPIAAQRDKVMEHARRARFHDESLYIDVSFGSRECGAYVLK